MPLIVFRLCRNALPVLISILALGCSFARAETARVATASNFAVVLQKIKPEFERQTGHHLSIVSGSTGKLYAQIRAGAPFDILLSADQWRAQKLEEKGAGVPGTRFTYAIGRLAVWDPDGEAIDADRLKRGEDKTIAMASPALAPYGQAAAQIMAAFGIIEDDSRKIVYGESVGQAFAFVRSRNADIGFVALSQVMSLPKDNRGRWWAPPASLYPEIRQDGVLLKHGRDNMAARDFMLFLKSDVARHLIAKMGYGVDQP